MNPRAIGHLRGVRTAWVSYAWDSAIFAVCASATVYLAIGDGLEGTAWLGLFVVGAAALWTGGQLTARITTHVSGRAMTVTDVNGTIRLSTTFSWLTGQTVTAHPGETVLVQLATDTRAIYLRNTGRGPLASVPRQDHVILVVANGFQHVAVPLYIRPSHDWITGVVKSLELAGLSVQLES